ncbi:MAG: alpha/beta hydrolase [Bacteroidota bacterium]
MKNLKQIIAQITPLLDKPSDELQPLIWQFICYPPKMPLRLHQEQLLNQAEHFSLKVFDEFFTGTYLSFNGFIWGNGRRKILITHGWGSKAADFSDLILMLREINDVQIIAFDAPGNGSSEGDLSNLLLFVQAIKAVVAHCGEPDILIGHSIGAMANVVALGAMSFTPSLLASITPLIKLKENFEASMTAIGIPQAAQDEFLENFEARFGIPASTFNMDDKYRFNAQLNHWLAYDRLDAVSPYAYMENFLATHPSIKTLQCDGAGHDRVLKSAIMLEGLVGAVRKALD